MQHDLNVNLSGRICLVSGASAGIGLQLCGRLAEAGADVVAVGRNTAGLQDAADRVRSVGRTCWTIEADLSSSEDTDRVVKEALEQAGTVDVLVNNAGVSVNHPLTEESITDWERTLAVNLRAPWLLARGFAPNMIARKRGKVINVSSLAAGIGMENHGSYTASKSGLNGLTKVMTAEWAPHNIQSNAICPTVTLTPMAEQVWGDPAKLGPMVAKIPAGRVAQPVEVCDVVLFLASTASDMINGETIFIDGGYTAL